MGGIAIYDVYLSGDARRLAGQPRLMEFWRFGKSQVEVFPDDMVPWLLTHGRPDKLPWSARHLD